MPPVLLGPVGLFGKLPATGDFVARGINAELRAQLDRWITLRILPEFEGRDWPAGGVRFLTPAPYMAGLIWPSRDRAGRDYPLVALTAAGPRTTVEDCDAWANSALSDVIAAAAGERTVDEIASALAGFAPPDESGTAEIRDLDIWAAGSA